MKKGQILSGQVIRLDFPNRGIVETKAGEFAVKNTLPGQQITFAITKIRQSDNCFAAEGRLLSIDKPSPQEIISPCPHYGQCGGCIMLSLPYDEQLRIKEEQLRRLLGFENFTGVLGSPRQFGYRNKMEFSFGDEYKGGPLALGMHKRASFYDVITVGECQIADEDYRRILMYTRDFFAGTGYPYYHRMKHIGFLRHLLVRKAAHTGEILIALVTTSKISAESPFDLQDNENGAIYLEYNDINKWKDGFACLELTGRVKGILHIINDSVADVVKADEIKILYGQDWFYEEILGLRFKITPFSFFQTNSYGAEVLYGVVRDYVVEAAPAKPVIFDLYCGTGTIAQLLSPLAKKIIGVDIVAEAISAARENAALNDLNNCEFLNGDVLKVLDEITEKPDFIILDPPRDGLHPKALRKILAYEIRHLLYISCKPTSLARDLPAFARAGYAVDRAVAVDMFPATGNVEVVCLLKKRLR
jgi:23S rRNA (uracil-5-)-methyltransferase RumA